MAANPGESLCFVAELTTSRDYEVLEAGPALGSEGKAKSKETVIQNDASKTSTSHGEDLLL